MKSVSYGNILPFLPTEIDSMIKSYDNPIFLHLLDMGVYYTVLHSAHMVREVIHFVFSYVSHMTEPINYAREYSF